MSLVIEVIQPTYEQILHLYPIGSPVWKDYMYPDKTQREFIGLDVGPNVFNPNAKFHPATTVYTKNGFVVAIKKSNFGEKNIETLFRISSPFSQENLITSILH